MGGLAGCGLGSYLLVHLQLVARKPFIIGLGFLGLAAALGAFIYVKHKTDAGGRFFMPGRHLAGIHADLTEDRKGNKE